MQQRSEWYIKGQINALVTRAQRCFNFVDARFLGAAFL